MDVTEVEVGYPRKSRIEIIKIKGVNFGFNLDVCMFLEEGFA